MKPDAITEDALSRISAGAALAIAVLAVFILAAPAVLL